MTLQIVLLFLFLNVFPAKGNVYVIVIIGPFQVSVASVLRTEFCYPKMHNCIPNPQSDDILW